MSFRCLRVETPWVLALELLVPRRFVVLRRVFSIRHWCLKVPFFATLRLVRSLQDLVSLARRYRRCALSLCIRYAVVPRIALELVIPCLLSFIDLLKWRRISARCILRLVRTPRLVLEILIPCLLGLLGWASRHVVFALSARHFIVPCFPLGLVRLVYAPRFTLNLLIPCVLSVISLITLCRHFTLNLIILKLFAPCLLIIALFDWHEHFPLGFPWLLSAPCLVLALFAPHLPGLISWLWRYRLPAVGFGTLHVKVPCISLSFMCSIGVPRLLPISVRVLCLKAPFISALLLPINSILGHIAAAFCWLFLGYKAVRIEIPLILALHLFTPGLVIPHIQGLLWCWFFALCLVLVHVEVLRIFPTTPCVSGLVRLVLLQSTLFLGSSPYFSPSFRCIAIPSIDIRLGVPFSCLRVLCLWCLVCFKCVKSVILFWVWVLLIIFLERFHRPFIHFLRLIVPIFSLQLLAPRIFGIFQRLRVRLLIVGRVRIRLLMLDVPSSICF